MRSDLPNERLKAVFNYSRGLHWVTKMTSSKKMFLLRNCDINKLDDVSENLEKVMKNSSHVTDACALWLFHCESATESVRGAAEVSSAFLWGRLRGTPSTSHSDGEDSLWISTDI